MKRLTKTCVVCTLLHLSFCLEVVARWQGREESSDSKVEGRYEVVVRSYDVGVPSLYPRV